jgi:hypothetical protein
MPSPGALGGRLGRKSIVALSRPSLRHRRSEGTFSRHWLRGPQPSWSSSFRRPAFSLAWARLLPHPHAGCSGTRKPGPRSPTCWAVALFRASRHHAGAFRGAQGGRDHGVFLRGDDPDSEIRKPPHIGLVASPFRSRKVVDHARSTLPLARDWARVSQVTPLALDAGRIAPRPAAGKRGSQGAGPFREAGKMRGK